MSNKHAAGPERDEAFRKEYVGNIWGPKFTMVGALLIILMVVFMYCEHQRTDTAPGFEKQEHPADRIFEKDSL